MCVVFHSYTVHPCISDQALCSWMTKFKMKQRSRNVVLMHTVKGHAFGTHFACSDLLIRQLLWELCCWFYIRSVRDIWSTHNFGLINKKLVENEGAESASRLPKAGQNAVLTLKVGRYYFSIDSLSCFISYLLIKKHRTWRALSKIHGLTVYSQTRCRYKCRCCCK